MLHAWAAGRYITRRMRRARAPKRRRGAAGAFRGLLGLGISGRIMNFISLMNLISLIGGGHAAACPYRMEGVSFGMGSGYYDVVGGYFGYGIGVGLPLAWVGGTHLYKVHYGVVVAVREVCFGVD